MTQLVPMSPAEFNELPDELFGNAIAKELGVDSTGATNDYILSVYRELKKREKNAGYKNWFVPGTPFGIDKCPKHKSFFDATRDYRQIMFRAGNRCLAEGTMVATPLGPTAIQNIREGDYVYDRHGVPTKVLKTWDNGKKPTVFVEAVDRGFQIECTSNHEFAVGAYADRQRADALEQHKVQVYTRSFNTHYAVGVYVRDSGKEASTYDITVEHPDHYYLLANGVVVSNCGKSVAGAYATTLFAIQDYPAWWDGRVFKGPVNIWACGKTVQITRDTVQKELLGQLGQIGSGMIPLARIKKLWARNGSPGCVDVAELYNDYGDVSTIGFKSYDQGVDAFVGTARHAIWEDEEPTEMVHNEILVRTTTTKGIVYNTVTPINGMTEYIANFDHGAAHLAGAETLAGAYDNE